MKEEGKPVPSPEGIAHDMVEEVVNKIQAAPWPKIGLLDLAFKLPGLIAAEEIRYAELKLRKLGAESAMNKYKNRVENDVVTDINNKVFEPPITKTGKDFTYEVNTRLETDDVFIGLEAIAVDLGLDLKKRGTEIGLMTDYLKGARAFGTRLQRGQWRRGTDPF